MRIPARVPGIILLAVLALLAGMWTATVTYTPSLPEEPASPPGENADPARPGGTPVEQFAGPQIPLFFHAGMGPGVDLDLIASEMAMAAEAGIHDFILSLPMPWGEQWEDLDQRIQTALTADPKANLILQLDLNPPPSWLAEHPGEAANPYPSIASQIWTEETVQGLQDLANHLDETATRDRIKGAVLAALEQGRWHRGGAADRSRANTAGFRKWLETCYSDEAGLQEAWANPEVTFDSAQVPPPPLNTETQAAGGLPGTTEVFFALPEHRINVDYLRYTSDKTAAVLVELTGHVKRIFGPEFQVLLPYGYGLELTSNASGHFALATLMDSSADAFISPVSYVARGLGEVGGMMGPVDSALAHGKQWYIVDDTRTGIARNPAGTVERPTGLRMADLVNLYRRNAARAALQGLRLVWSDPAGTGNLHDKEIWEEFSNLRALYNDIRRENGQGAPDLCVVLDEESRFYQQCDVPLNKLLLTGIRDTALRSGASTAFILLQDLIQGKTEPASVYLFLNAFQLSESERNILHALFAEQGAAAIWMYAPGYIDDTPALEHLAATTRMNVEAFEEPARSGSTYALTGNWTTEGDSFGVPGLWSPLFRIQDDKADPLAHFSRTDYASVAIKFVEEGWASIYICEPTLPLPLLREILDILNVHLALRESTDPGSETLQPGGLWDAEQAGGQRSADQVSKRFLLLHAGSPGVRLLDFGEPCDITDRFDSRMGWSQKQMLTVSMKTGETRLYEARPSKIPQAQPAAGAPPRDVLTDP